MTAQAEQANNNASHKGNGDKENHFDEAHKKTARDFYVKVEGKTRDEARKIVDGLVARGLLKDLAFYVKAIKDEAVRQENIAKREQAQKEQREREQREEQARRDDFARRQAEKEQAKANAKANKGKVEPEECKLDALQQAMIDDFINKGATKQTIAGLLRDLFQFNKGQVAYLIDELFPSSSAKGSRAGIFEGDTFKGRFYRRLLEGFMSVEEFDAMIAKESENVIKHKSAHNNVRVMSNRIHEKYAAG